ncbi:MAG TPA: hypothetical protein PKN33_10240 [Phycisphaerae bacterium]|nr:hypothetical protein [Phycisphaerae bacterium]
MPMRPAKTSDATASGRIWFEGDIIRYESEGYGSWRWPLGRVRVIGEMTNDQGPFRDDYFFCFATGPECWFEASYYAEGSMPFLFECADRLGTEMLPGLTGSTDHANRILWPQHLVDEPMFEFSDDAPTGLWRRCVRFFLPQVRQVLSDVAMRELTNASP